MTALATESLLPIGTKKQWAGPAGTHAASQRQAGVLVVDDQECVRGVLEVMLRRQGLAVWLAADGCAAIDLYRAHHAAIDLVLLDVRMPGLDGPETLIALRRLNPQVCCCFLSGDFGEYTEERLRALGAAAVFLKPFRLADLGRVVRQLTSGEEGNPAVSATACPTLQAEG